MQPIVEFTEAEKALLRDLQIAVYRNKIILEARPPITDAELHKVEKRIRHRVAPALVDLWRTAFGGRLGYNLEFPIGDYLFEASLTDLFYPESNHSDDLYGWIDYEEDLWRSKHKRWWRPSPKGIPFVPFGGIDQQERCYISLGQVNYGKIYYYTEGIPWDGFINEGSGAQIANSLPELFDALSLNEDPYEVNSEDYCMGQEMAERIQEIECEHPDLGQKLKKLMLASLFDWRTVVEWTSFSGELSAKENKGLRLACQFAIRRDDTNLINDLHKRGAPFDIVLRLRQTVLVEAMVLKAYRIVEQLLDFNVELGKGTIWHAEGCPNELLKRLVSRGVPFNEYGLLSAAESGAIDGAIVIFEFGKLVDRTTVAELIDKALKQAIRRDSDAIQANVYSKGIDTPKAIQFRAYAKALREFAQRLKGLGE